MVASEVPARSSPWLSSWAPPRSRLGALQRGRGDGFRAALIGGREAAAEVVRCVVADPRWDRQVEARDGYYARLLLALAADLGPISARLAALAEDAPLDSPDLWLPLGVCSELAVRGHAGAIEILASLVASTRLWRPCLDTLELVGGEALIGVVVSLADAAALVARVPSAELDEVVDEIAAPWNAWAAEIPALRPALTPRDADPSRSRSMSGPVSRIAHHFDGPSPAGAIDPSLSAGALLEIEPRPGRSGELAELLDARRDAATTAALLRVASSAAHRAQVLALRLLGRRACVDLIGEAAAFLHAEAASDAQRRYAPLRRAYIDYLEALPAETVLPLARAWFHEPWPLSLAAGEIFGRHATADDRPVLEAAGAAALANGEVYRLCHIVEALEVVGDAASIAFLCAVVRDAPYSYLRGLALAALVPHVEHAEVAAIFTDALWDAELTARWIACEQADLASPSVRARLDEIVADDREDKQLRALARELTTGS